MAQHCINYTLKTNEHFMNEQERLHPVSAEAESLIRASLKEEYHKPMRDWYLIQSDKKRARFTALCRGQASTKKLPQRPSTASTTGSFYYQVQPDLIARDANGVIDLNRSFYGDAPRRFLNSKRFAPTAIKTEGVFGFPPPYKTQSVDGQPKYSEFIVKKLFKPSVAKEIMFRADEYFDLLQELLKWFDKKTNDYPIDPIKGRKNLEPRTEGALTKAKLDEDHIWPAGRRRPKRPQTAKPPVERSRGAKAIKNFMTTNYMDCFCDEAHQSWLKRSPDPRRPCKPIKNPAPYAMFPINPYERERSVPDPYILEQARENRISGKMNRAIFESKTCL